MVIISEHKFTRFIFIMCKPLIFFNSRFFSGNYSAVGADESSNLK